jgi:hypothetical protein
VNELAAVPGLTFTPNAAPWQTHDAEMIAQILTTFGQLVFQ